MVRGEVEVGARLAEVTEWARDCAWIMSHGCMKYVYQVRTVGLNVSASNINKRKLEGNDPHS